MNNRPKVTLCMIVKDETHVIEQCLRSIAPYIDRYDITDTGSTDGTQELIKKTMEELNIPGEVHQSDWKGFGDHNGSIGSRTESLMNAEKSDADYAWVIDADDFVTGKFEYPQNMDADSYSLQIGRGDFTWWRNQIFKLSVGWRYVGILHEYATTKENIPRESLNFAKIEGPYKINARTEGARNVGITPKEKYERDAKVLEGALEDEPENERYMFYLAQSYFDSQQWEKSFEMYKKRADKGGWPEEVYYSRLRCALLKGIMEKPLEEIAQAFLEAFNSKPDRAEPLWFLSKMYRNANQPAVAYIYARMAAEIPYPKNDILFIQDDVYRWGALDELGATAFYGGRPDIGYQATKRLMEIDYLPVEHRERIQNNHNSYIKVLSDMKVPQEVLNQKDSSSINTKKEVNKNKKSTRVPEKKGYKKRK